MSKTAETTDEVMSDTPLVSVVIPVFNAGAFLCHSVDSVLAQKFTDFELLAFDDGSTDDSDAVLRRYAHRDPRVKVIGGKHKGYAEWLNEGLRQARGQYIARMDADDVSLPGRFGAQVAFLQAHPEVLAVGGQAMVIDSDSDRLHPYAVPQLHEEIDSAHMAGRGGMLIHPAVMMRRDAVASVGGYRTEFEPAEDYDLWLRLGEKGRLANLPTEVLQYRVHAKSVTRTRFERQMDRSRRALAEAKQRRGSEEDGISRFFDGRVTMQPSLVEQHRDWAWRAREAGNHKAARKYAWRVLLTEPWAPSSWGLAARAMAGETGRRLAKTMRRSAR